LQVEELEVMIEPGFTENCYILTSSKEPDHVVIIDPGAQAEKVAQAVGPRIVDSIILTHRHHDHTGAASALVKKTGAQVFAHRLDADEITSVDQERYSFESTEPDPVESVTIVEDGDRIPVGTESLLVIHTPGHSIGSICLYNEPDGILIAGDTLFFEAVGRTDFPTGDARQQQESLKKLAKLPDETRVYPGHDVGTTIGHERRYGYLR
jgi:glyoxylase-like metal-dependent hydrolase (beta-lactamase superfamily II)